MKRGGADYWKKKVVTGTSYNLKHIPSPPYGLLTIKLVLLYDCSNHVLDSFNVDRDLDSGCRIKLEILPSTSSSWKVSLVTRKHE